MKILVYIAWVIRAYYNHNIQHTPCQYFIGRDVILNIVSVIDKKVIIDGKQQQLDIDNVQENARRVTHDYAVGKLVYVILTDIYQKLDHKK